jgi:excisionase family DNA binding protein
MSATTAAPAATIVDNRTGESTSIDARTFAALKVFLRSLGAAYVDEEPSDARLTTGQAAQIVGSSPRTIARLIDSGRLKGSRVGGGHRYVMLSDLLAFDRQSRAERGVHLDEMRRIAAEEGFYDHNNEVSEYLKGFE